MKGLNFFGKILLPVLSVVFLINGCKAKKIVYKSPPHYDFAEVFPDKLDLHLKEISGVVWDTSKDEFIAHNDEMGKIFYLDKDTKITKREFQFSAKKGDYEDIAIAKGIVYVLRSDGMITKIITDSAGKQHPLEAGAIELPGTNDFESMYYDAGRNALIIICKNCSDDDKKTVSAFAFYIDSTGFDKKPVFTIDAKKIEELSPRKTSKFQPSGAAINPKLNQLFILSSASNQLVITDLNGEVQSVTMLARKLFPQPEGITFKSSGDMYISNEAVTSKSSLLKFTFKP
jgi:uncharacterized protein YjiK